MGDIADLMLEGGMCQWCGEILDPEAGFPTICAGCQASEGVDQHGTPLEDVTQAKRTMTCSEKGCNRKFKTHDAYLQHWKDKHA